MTEQKLFPAKAEHIARKLIKMARMRSRQGYGTTHLIFSDGSIVTLADSGLRLISLLGAGHQPLGFIAPDRDRKRSPFIEAWEIGDNAAVAELRSLAHSLFWHLLPERNAQTGNAPQRGK